jgi:hypothetical protein
MSEQDREEPAAKNQAARPSYELQAGDFSFQIFEPPTQGQEKSNNYDVQGQADAVLELMRAREFGCLSLDDFEPPTQEQLKWKDYYVHVQYQNRAVFEPMRANQFRSFTYLELQYRLAVLDLLAFKDIKISFDQACDFSQGATETCFLVDALQNGRTVKEWWEAGGKNQQVVVRAGDQEFVPELDQSPELE